MNIVKVIAGRMLNNDIFEEEMLSQLQMVIQELTFTQVKLKKARTAARTVIDNARIEQETRFRELKLSERNNGAISSVSDLSKQIRLVPMFRKYYLNDYF